MVKAAEAKAVEGMALEMEAEGMETAARVKVRGRVAAVRSGLVRVVTRGDASAMVVEETAVVAAERVAVEVAMVATVVAGLVAVGGSTAG